MRVEKNYKCSCVMANSENYRIFARGLKNYNKY